MPTSPQVLQGFRKLMSSRCACIVTLGNRSRKFLTLRVDHPSLTQPGCGFVTPQLHAPAPAALCRYTRFDVDVHSPTGHEDWDPYWARPWPSAAALAARLLQGGDPVAGAAVAELGAGLGLAGLAAALAGATSVTFDEAQCLLKE
jgi:hypothetical protein